MNLKQLKKEELVSISGGSEWTLWLAEKLGEIDRLYYYNNNCVGTGGGGSW